ncbi:MAG TPA: hypothetical protein VFM70_11385 [Salinimicrobium sp.]|nr:hypothetical protein [Salinimicrobium sp.]
MNKRLTLIFLMCVGFTFYAQQDASIIPVDIQMSEVFKDDKRFTELSFSTEDNNGGIFIGRHYKDGCYIEHYDSNAKLIKNHDFELDNSKSNIHGGFLSGDDFCLLESTINKETKSLEYYVYKSPKNEFNFKKELLFSIPLKEVKKNMFSFGFFSGSSDNDILGAYEISRNKKFIAFTVDIKNADSETHRLFVFDNALNKVYETEFTRDLKDRKFILQNIDIDENDGTVYLLGKAFSREKKKKKDGGKYQFELFKINANSQNSLVFDSEENYVGSLTTVINQGKLFCIGFYSEKNDFRYKGLAYFDVDSKNMTLNNSVYSSFTEQFMFDKYGKDKEKELRNISFKNIFVTENNECIVNAEEFFIRSHYVATQYGGYWYYTYHFNDMISAKVGVNGDLQWARNINKKQSSDHYSSYLSYASTYYEGKTYLFLNGSDKIRKLRKDRLQFKDVRQRKSNLYVITLDQNGDFEYMKILDDKDSEVPFAVGNGIISANGKELTFQGRKGRKKQIMKISL